MRLVASNCVYVYIFVYMYIQYVAQKTLRLVRETLATSRQCVHAKYSCTLYYTRGEFAMSRPAVGNYIVCSPTSTDVRV